MEDYIEHKVKTKVEKFFTKGFKILFMILAAIVFLLLFGYVFMWLWNWLVPDIFGLKTVTYWQAVGLLVFAKLVFGGFEGSGPGKKSGKRRKKCGPKSNWGGKTDFSKWKHYDKFWEEEGEKAYNDYINRTKEKEQ